MINLCEDIDNEIFHLVGDVADEMNREVYVIGGYVRDLLLKRHSPDIDFVTVGSGIELAREVAKRLGRRATLSVYASYGTAQVKYGKYELEFVGARKESYNRDSRNPIVEDGTLADDQARRDFTVNILALALNKERFGDLIDPYNGLIDMHNKILRTPGDPDITFSDDPLRMMRAVRFATQLGFEIEPETLQAIARNKKRIEIIKRERINTELSKILLSPKPSIGFRLLDSTGLLKLIFPEIDALKGVESHDGKGHKDIFLHTLQVVDNVAMRSNFEWLRWAALLHDIGKPETKRFEKGVGWTFRNHNYIGARITERLFRKYRMPMNSKMKYVVKMIDLHMRPQSVGESGVTDSAIRRLRTDACSCKEGPLDLDDLAELMILADADLTSKNPVKVKRVLESYAQVRKRLVDVTVGDLERETPAAIGGDEIIDVFGLSPSPLLGEIKTKVNIKVEDENLNHSDAFDYLLSLAPEFGVEPVADIAAVKEKWARADEERRRDEKAKLEKAELEKIHRDEELGRTEHPSLPLFGRTII